MGDGLMIRGESVGEDEKEEDDRGFGKLLPRRSTRVERRKKGEKHRKSLRLNRLHACV